MDSSGIRYSSRMYSRASVVIGVSVAVPDEFSASKTRATAHGASANLVEFRNYTLPRVQPRVAPIAAPKLGDLAPLRSTRPILDAGEKIPSGVRAPVGRNRKVAH